MPDSIRTNPTAPELKEWTLMFYFASDDQLATNVVSKIK